MFFMSQISEPIKSIISFEVWKNLLFQLENIGLVFLAMY
mgnify:CR=1 FL=1